MQILADQDFSSIDLPDAPAGVPPAFDDHVNLMLDLTALAYQTDLTRVVSFMIAAEISMLTYNQVGVSEAFHPLVAPPEQSPTRWRGSRSCRPTTRRCSRASSSKLASTPDGDGSLLDHSILLYGSNMSDSNLHNADPLPSAVFGHGYGRIKGGQHLKPAQDTPHANLMLTLLERGGIPVESLGNSTGELTEV